MKSLEYTVVIPSDNVKTELASLSAVTNNVDIPGILVLEVNH